MTIRTVAYAGTVALLAQIVLVQGCGSNNPSTSNTGGTPSTGGVATPTGGTPSAGGVATPTGGTPSTGGVVTPTGGTPSTGGVVTPTGGTMGTAGATGTSTGGTTAAGGTTATGAFEPLCANLITAAGSSPTKNGVCTATDPPLCYKTCGPKSSGFKSETCTGGSYVEQAGCNFPAGDYSCFKIPATLDPTCPTTAPQANTPCTVADCVLCSDPAGGYLDSTGAAKTGYCVCPNTSAGPGKWSCASSTAWPCPAGQGC